MKNCKDYAQLLLQNSIYLLKFSSEEKNAIKYLKLLYCVFTLFFYYHFSYFLLWFILFL